MATAFQLFLITFLGMLSDSDGFHGYYCLPHHYHRSTTSRRWALHAGADAIVPPTVWIQDAEEDFVDEDENLEDGEICLKSVKAFASPVLVEDVVPRFLSAGALVQRPTIVEDIRSVCDAWTADAILEEGGPNLQLQGASLVLDDLFQFHLEQQPADPIGALQTFVVQCGSIENETSCASYMAANSRGFRPLKDLVRESSIYTKSAYLDGSLDGMVLEINKARVAYGRLIEMGCPNHGTISKILQLLPDDDLIQRFTIKRFSAK
ncbi:unnamed protein product [Cylindrotheca closterium]|uniref:Uncharacterized protein n=1 Tax=Cylindrotheca closterium TaxID=2856 RepID=A0AAD2JMK9_9STRA|nr:unnamed protein product [Cylindrotheca closterium]